MQGGILKKKREESGKDLKEIAHILRIRYDYLKAIEENDFDKLPEPVYTKGYIRGYANFLGIDPAPIIKAYAEKLSPKPPEGVVPETDKPKKSPAKFFFIIATLAIITAVYFLISRPAERTETPHPIVQPPVSIAPVAEEKSSAILLPEEPPAQEKTINRKGHTLEIKTEDTTWVMVTMDDSESREMLLNPGQSANFSAMQRFTLKIGNAGGIKLLFDGKDLGSPGKKGEVLTLNLPENKTDQTP